MLTKYFTKKFYKTDYKKEKRINTLLYFFITITAFTLVTAPFIFYNSIKFYKIFVSQVNNLPSQMAVNYSKEDGLTTNIKAPAIVDVPHIKTVIDPYNLYTPDNRTKQILVFRNKGILVYRNNKVSEQKTYQSFKMENFSFSIGDLKSLISRVHLESKFYLLAIIIFAGLFLRGLITGLFVSFVFAIVPYVAQRDKRSLTYLQNVKFFMYLLPIYFFGLTLAILTLGTLNGLGIISLAIAYFWVRG